MDPLEKPLPFELLELSVELWPWPLLETEGDVLFEAAALEDVGDVDAPPLEEGAFD